MKLIKHTYLLLIILATSITYAQVKFEAKVSKQKLGVNERLRVDFEMNQDIDLCNFSPPSFTDFTVIAGPNQALSTTWVKGVRKEVKTFIYYLQPKKKGTLAILRATIKIDNTVYKTVPIKIKVTDAVDIPKNTIDTNQIASKNVHLVTEISETNPYLNEAVTLVTKLYVSPKIALDNWNVVETPTFNYFSAKINSAHEQKIQNGIFNGEDYLFVVLNEIELCPKKVGEIVIEPLILEFTLQVPSGRVDILGNDVLLPVHSTVSSEKTTINVKDLPKAEIIKRE